MQHLVERTDAAVPITPLTADGLARWLETQDEALAGWVRATGFTAKPGAHALIPDASGGLARVLAGVQRLDDPWALAGLPTALPQGTYRLDTDLEATSAELLALGWALGSYAFTRYVARQREPAALVWPARADRAAVTRAAEATALVRDLINTPANDMGPAALADAVRREGKRHGARVEVIEGDKLLRRNYPAIHAVGRAAAHAPRLADLRWNAGGGPQVTLVGKGVCFDTGGLDLKPANNMKLMKKDMGGAAHALALARMIMDAGLPVSLRLLVPCVENSVSADAFRPQDVLQTRKGLTVEVGNTDAEGRLVLADALAEAAADSPELVLDFATLTGAARAALGPDVPALFSNDDALARRIQYAGERVHDRVWQMPLVEDYRSWLKSEVADLVNVPDSGFAGAITAALFLQRFVPEGTAWAHLDQMAWNTSPGPGRPKGGEAMGLRAAYTALTDWLASRSA
ncbi:leucyl aminopeptidase [Limimonas halophila]|uniref:Leucyl aminopeptidase n=1 Tax=Limimonas halophila TaxID=1082479 RepID=A0A1G7TRE1_9PROT|nr:leucyl aminopeptidase family protein [Limimonas halophila]SDG37742.1 leucyl aminopeptidase [Limimonas halophila]